jgi:uncharacterized Zn finger protein
MRLVAAENPCKHIAAVLYVFADQLDTDPWLVLAWRGRTRDQLLERVGAVAAATPTDDEVAPWWPFGPGPLPILGESRRSPSTEAAQLDRPDGVLDALEPLEVQMGGTAFTELLGPAYDHLTTG